MSLIAWLTSVPLLLDVVQRLASPFRVDAREGEALPDRLFSFGRLGLPWRPDPWVRDHSVRYVRLWVPGLYWEFDIRTLDYRWHRGYAMWLERYGWSMYYVPIEEDL